jgi:hypothetical protein
MSRILVLYATNHGSTRQVADAMRRAAVAGGAEVDLMSVESMRQPLVGWIWSCWVPPSTPVAGTATPVGSSSGTVPNWPRLRWPCSAWSAPRGRGGLAT